MAPVAMRVDPPPMLRYRRHFETGQTVFLTMVTSNRRAWLAGDGIRTLVLDALRETRPRYPFVYYGHVLLDDHMHMLITPHESAEVASLVGSFKRAVKAKLPPRTAWPDARLWQRRYHDHIIRDEEDFARHLDYLHFNPVKHGLATDAATWRWSSFAAWQARGVYPAGWGRIEPERIRDMTE